MKNDIVVTNLRIPRYDWLQIRSVASEIGLSANEYVQERIIKIYKEEQKNVRKKKTASLLDLIDIAKIPGKPMGASEDDKIIYGIDD